MKNKWKWWLILIFLILLVAMALEKADFNKEEKEALSEQLQPVVVQKGKVLEKEEGIILNGDIVSFQEASVSAKIAAKAESVIVENGTFVNEGQALVMLQQIDYQNALAVAEAALEKAEAGLHKSELDYERCRELYAQGAVSESTYDDTDIALRVARADVKAAHAAVSSAREVLNNTTITAPFAGLVANCNIHTGEIVNPGSELMRVVDISSVYVVTNIKQKDVARVEKGQEAMINVPGLNNHEFMGTVAAVNPVGNSSARVFAVKIKVKNEEALLKPGMFATAEIKTGVTSKVMAVPANSVIGQSGRQYVFIVEGQKARQQEVKTASMLENMVEVTSGLEKDQQIIISNVNNLKDGDLIEICR
ncbi:MAG: efflux RND transporter periplasmic adaptor subunit [Syntrophomonadaceae bacterium]|nr:efflux RND transporter periplasmic adaptor subunit [Syntrophomonadaceae bacterium]